MLVFRIKRSFTYDFVQEAGNEITPNSVLSLMCCKSSCHTPSNISHDYAFTRHFLPRFKLNYSILLKTTTSDHKFNTAHNSAICLLSLFLLWNQTQQTRNPNKHRKCKLLFGPQDSKFTFLSFKTWLRDSETLSFEGVPWKTPEPALFRQLRPLTHRSPGVTCTPGDSLTASVQVEDKRRLSWCFDIYCNIPCLWFLTGLLAIWINQ